MLTGILNTLKKKNVKTLSKHISISEHHQFVSDAFVNILGDNHQMVCRISYGFINKTLKGLHNAFINTGLII